MASLAPFGQPRRCLVAVLTSGRPNRRIEALVPRAQGANGYSDTAPLHQYPRQPQSMYYGSSPPPASQYTQARPQPQTYEPQYPPEPHQAANQSVQGAQPTYAPPIAPGNQQAPQYPSAQYTSTQYTPSQPPSPGGIAPSGLSRVNPGKNHINSVRLMGTIFTLERKGRCAYANIKVPYSTKEGFQEFLVEAWDADGTNLMGLQGVQVLLDGRLAQDASRSGGFKVVVNRIQLVDQTLPATGYRVSQAGGEGGGTAPKTRVSLEPQQVYKMHYSTPTRTLKALASHFGVPTSTVERALLPYAFQTSSPLHWSALAEEAGIGPNDEVQLLNFMEVVAKYKADLAAMYDSAKPGATPPPLPATSNGMLKVKPIREWALARPEPDTHRYTVSHHEAKYGLSKLYDALRMAVVAEATQGAWSIDAEFPPV